MDFRHVIMTRFNLPTPGREASFRNQPDWLDGRMDLFERYCLSMLAAQDCQDFRWIIYFDEATPAPVRDRIEAARKVRPFTPWYTGLFPSEGWRKSVLELLGEDRGEALLTTNLDNDDGLARDYVSRLHEAARAHWALRPCALNFTNGFIINGPRLFAHRHVSNAFTNLLEPYDERLRTAPAIRHMEVAHYLPVAQIPGPGAWLQVVHGGNVSNRIRGRRVGTAEVNERFPHTLIAGVAQPRRAELLAERLVTGPIRDSRDILVNALRSVLSWLNGMLRRVHNSLANGGLRR
jgi:hypothetical protein